MSPEKKKVSKTFVIVVASIAATGGLLFGFDIGVISGAGIFLQDAHGWGVTSSQLEWIASAALIGAVLGALFCGKITDMLGRKKVIIATAFLATIGTYIAGAAPTILVLVIGRLMTGVAIGVASFTVPLYISEISPTRLRGALVTLNQLLISIGFKLASISDYVIADDANPYSWRWMFYVGIFPGLILFTGMMFLPETPRWLISKGFEAKGRAILNKVEDPELIEESISKMKDDVAHANESASYREIFKPWLRNALIIAVGIMFFQQFIGLNTLLYYSPQIFKMAGITSNTQSIIPTILIGIVGFLFTVLSIVLLDRYGRRKLYFFGVSGTVVSLIVIGLLFYFDTMLGSSLKYFALVAMFFYIAFYAISLGPLGWLLISEVFPLKVRGIGMSIGSVSNWFFNGLVAFTFLKLVNAFTISGAYWLYAIIGIAALIWGYYYIPETKGVTLEKIEDHWREGKSPREL
ncbi:MAG: sugar porter family MFS transporter [Prolixibacteraceae bacterium]|jgi:sugar porter (SP) family MFS transporter|nr:sugar porter family MFS transporter [Prolixibacteraceae bacterium]